MPLGNGPARLSCFLLAKRGVENVTSNWSRPAESRSSRPSLLDRLAAGWHAAPPTTMANDGVLPAPDFGPARLNKDNSADNPASEQGVKHSAILPDAGGEGSGCAHHQK